MYTVDTVGSYGRFDDPEWNVTTSTVFNETEMTRWIFGLRERTWIWGPSKISDEADVMGMPFNARSYIHLKLAKREWNRQHRKFTLIIVIFSCNAYSR